ncbi:F-box protein CPR1-like [Vicia villosa]|uniref:F-box protein CPR1-like n=1 Tax=Vicia villosa TaxID=3911 RepID=UPI00273BFC59|nr:F-box protein CPR1-like [Vicia villosa]
MYKLAVSDTYRCNGTLCLEYHNIYGDLKLMLWNPTTAEVKLIPDKSNSFSNVWAHHYQVGYDRVKDDYKMIRCTHSPKSHRRCSLQVSSFWEIFSLKTNSWRKIHDDMPHSDRCVREVYLDGVSHWWDQCWLVSFDFIKESFITTTIPSYERDVFYFNPPLAVLNGSIAFMRNYEETSTFHISILGELGVGKSWTKFFIVGPLPCLMCPIGIGKKGNILIRKKDDGLAWFDLSTGTIYDIGVTAGSDCKLLYQKESLLPIGGIYSKFSSCFHPEAI